MDINVKKLEKSRVEISVSIPWDEWKGEIDHAVEHLAKDVKVEGFRPGKAPRAMIEGRLGKAAVIIEGAEHAIDHFYPDVLSQAKVEAIGNPEVRLDGAKEGEALRFTATTAVMPEIVLKSWEKKVREANKERSEKQADVSEEEREKELQKLVESRAKFVTVDREARIGDMAEVDFEVTRDSIPVEGGSGKRHPIVLGKGAFIPGFEEQILGMKAGGEKSFSLSFPENYHMEALAGKSADFRVNVLLVQERQLPEATDEFARSLGNFKNLVELKESIAEGLRMEREHEEKERRRVAILEALISEAEAEIPDVLVEGELRRMISEFGSQVAMTGMTLSDYLARMNKTEEDLAKDWRSQAEKRILSGLVLEHLAEARDINPEQADIEAEMNKTLAYVKSVKRAEGDIDLPALYESARSRLRNEKLFGFLEKL